MRFKAIAVMPVYNEEKRVGRIVREARKYTDGVIAVIDGSRDGSLSEAKKAGARVLKNEVNMGLGFTLRRGVEEAVRTGADAIVTIDSDGQHDPSEIPRLLEELRKNRLDVVIGSRPCNENMPAIKRFGNHALCNLSRLLFGICIRDTQSGFKAFTPGAFEKMKWHSDRFNVCSEIVMNICKNRLKYKEIPVKTIYAEGHDTHVSDVADGIKIGLGMIRWRILGR